MYTMPHYCDPPGPHWQDDRWDMRVNYIGENGEQGSPANTVFGPIRDSHVHIIHSQVQSLVQGFETIKKMICSILVPCITVPHGYMWLVYFETHVNNTWTPRKYGLWHEVDPRERENGRWMGTWEVPKERTGEVRRTRHGVAWGGAGRCKKRQKNVTATLARQGLHDQGLSGGVC